MSSLVEQPLADICGTAEARGDARKVFLLILGGNGMLGSSFIANIVSRLGPQRVDITLLNRGRKYWDSDERVNLHVSNHIKCDRKDVQKHGEEIFAQRNRFDYCIDFSGYRSAHVKSILKCVRITRRYLYISSDSIYEVCQQISHSGPIVEEDAVRPSDKTTRKRLNSADDYGHKKLKGEEVLMSATTGTLPIKYIALRLPDVIGPRDNTDRIFNYILWLRTHKDTGVPVKLMPRRKQKPLSFVHCDSVASALSACILLTLENDTLLTNVSLNLADGNDSGIYLREFLGTMASEMGISDGIEFVENNPNGSDDSDDDDDGTYYPSVTRGPICSKAARDLLRPMWIPMEICNAIKSIVSFYENDVLSCAGHGVKKFKDEIQETCDDLFEELDLSKTQIRQFKQKITAYYKYSMH